MTRIRPAAFAVVVAGSMLVGGVVGAVAYGASTVAALAASPSPTATPAAGTAPTSNEDATHEQGETAAEEAAENNGTARHGGHGGPGGAPNEDPAHEAGESAAREAQEHAAKPAAPTATPTPSGS